VNYLLDTNILSEAKQKHPDPRVLSWLAKQSPTDCYLSVISLGEIQEGISALGSTKKARALAEWLASLKQAFQGRILPIDEQLIATWGDLRGQARAKGRPLPVIDSLLAATAITHNLTLVTRNTADFEASGIKLFNPWLG
jgi:predicted nucleic acid-binding protein